MMYPTKMRLVVDGELDASHRPSSRGGDNRSALRQRAAALRTKAAEVRAARDAMSDTRDVTERMLDTVVDRIQEDLRT